MAQQVSSMKRQDLHSASLAVLSPESGVSSQHTTAMEGFLRRLVSGGGCLYAIPLIPRLPGVGARAAHASVGDPVAPGGTVPSRSNIH